MLASTQTLARFLSERTLGLNQPRTQESRHWNIPSELAKQMEEFEAVLVQEYQHMSRIAQTMDTAEATAAILRLRLLSEALKPPICVWAQATADLGYGQVFRTAHAITKQVLAQALDMGSTTRLWAPEAGKNHAGATLSIPLEIEDMDENSLEQESYRAAREFQQLGAHIPAHMVSHLAALAVGDYRMAGTPSHQKIFQFLHPY